MPNDSQKLALEVIKRSGKILIMPSSPPDGDSLGSALSLYIALKKLGKEVTVVCSDSIPEVLQFLPNIKMVGDKIISSNDFIISVDLAHAKLENVKSEIENGKVNIIITPKEGNFSEDDVHFNKAKIDYDLIITVDCAELIQLRGFYEKNVEMFYQIPVLNIDHHISNTHYGKINYVDIMASATTEVILPLLEDLGKEENTDLIDEDIATLLLTGIITDTGSFQNSNTSPRAFAKAAQLISYGARQQEIIQHIYKTKQLSQLKLWGRVLSKIQIDEKNKIVWSTVSQQDFRDTESSEDETGDIIDELMTNAPGAEIVILLKEKADGSISGSMRTINSAVDASKLSENFGGGGHARAAGFRMIDISLRDAEYKVISKVREFQAQRGGYNTDSEKTETPTEPTKVPEPMINVPELIERAKSAEKATEIMKTVTPTPVTAPISKIEPEKPVAAPNPELPKKEKSKTPKKEPLEKSAIKFRPAVNDDNNSSTGVTYKFED